MSIDARLRLKCLCWRYGSAAALERVLAQARDRTLKFTGKLEAQLTEAVRLQDEVRQHAAAAAMVAILELIEVESTRSC